MIFLCEFQAPGALARQFPNFGDATGYGAMGAEFFSLAADTDIARLLKGLEGDACPSPQWGYLLAGRMTVSYTDRTEETIFAGDLFFWLAGALRARHRRCRHRSLQSTTRARPRHGSFKRHAAGLTSRPSDARRQPRR
jgi:hypothetical protein